MEADKSMEDPTSVDAEWKRIQQNTFTRWCNEHLKKVNQFIYNLETDLCDGLKLIALLQLLSHKKINKYNKKPTFRPQKLENCAIALKFIEDEKIKLVNIDAGDILKGNLKLILGLIWTLILKYQISIPMMDDDESANVTPKQALLGWVKSKLPPQVRVNNFTSDWNNGIALASLVDACAPGLMPEWEDLDPKNALDNCKEAMQRADDWLGVPQVLTPEEISNPMVDELSVMTYVSYFPEAKPKPGAPIKTLLSDAGNCNAYGPGLEPEGVLVNAPADFTVVTTGSSRGKLNISVLGPGKQLIDCLTQDNHNNTFSCQYIPPKPGTYDVHIRIGNHHIPKSPFRVKVSSDLDVKKVYARGPGIEPSGVVVGKPTYFEVVATGAGSGEPHVDVIDPKGNKKTEIKLEDKGNGIFVVHYLPAMTGKYVICVKFGGEEISKSPFRVQVDHPATKVKIYGPGLEPGLKVGKPAVFTVDCTDASDGSLDISVEGPGKTTVPVDVQDNGDGTFTCTYKPSKAGTYIVTVFLERQQVPKSPVKVTIASGVDLSKIKAWGPGLEKGVAGSPAEFYVEAKGTPVDALSFAIEGPGEAKFEVTESGPQKCTVRYYPKEPGQYTVHVLAEELDIPHSPFKVQIHPKGDAKKVYAEGPGLRPGCCTGKPATFTIYAQKAGGSGHVDVTCTDGDGNPVEVKVKDNKDDTYSVSYMPVRPGKYTVVIKFGGEDIDQSPFVVPITPFSDPSLVKAHGPGLKGGKTGKPCEFKIDASQAGEGGIGLTIEGPKESKIDCDDNGDGTCSVKYHPEEDGDYVINILFADTHIPGSPFKAIVSSDFDASKVKAYGPGLEPGCKAGRPCEITIDAKSAGRAKLQVEVTDDAGKPVNVDLQEKEPGLYNAAYHPEKPGKYTILISFGGKPIPKSPFKVTVESSTDPTKVKVSGPGIEPAGVKSLEPTFFEIDASEAGDGNVDVSIEPEGRNMPKVTDIQVEDGKKPNTYKVKYVAPKEGPYLITVKFGGKNVPKSPFKVGVKPGVAGIKCYGPGLEEPLVGQEVPFTVDCGPDAGDEKPVVEIVAPDGKKIKPTVSSKKKGVYDVTWTPKQPGKHKVVVLYAGEEVPDSPFNVNAVEKGDASKVKASGPGLDHAFINKPNTFDIDTRAAGPGNLGLAIEGPAESKITCEENPDGTHTVSYTPVELGDYDINIKFGDEHIPGSPFKVPAEKPVDASKVKCSGPGLEKVPASLPTHFTVDAKSAGKAPLDVEIIGPDRKKKKPKIKNNGDSTFDVEYVPDVEGKYTIGVKYGGNTVPQSPFRVTAVPTGDASKCKVSGPGVERAPVGVPAKFKVDATKAGPGKVTASAKNPKGEELPVTVKEVDDGVFACNFVPEEVGEHEVDVLFGGVPVKGSPFHPQAVEPIKADLVKTPGLEEMLYESPAVETPVEGMVDTSEAGKGKLDATLQTPTGKKLKVGVSDNGDGTYTMNFTPKEVGHYVLTILFEGSNVPGSPFEFEVVEGGPRKVKVYGPGIRKGFTGRPNCFTVDTKNAGPGGLSLAVEGPSQADINCIDNGDGTCLVTYTPDQPGDYDIIVKFADEDVPGSPFKVKVVEDEPIYEVGRPCDVEMEPNNVSMPEDQPVISGVLATPHGKEKPIGVKKGPKDGPDNAVIASFTPEEVGKHDVGVKKRGKDVDGSPKPVYVRDKPVIGKPCEVPMECADVERPNDLPYTKATLTRPNDKEEPLDLKVYPDGTLSVTFVPKEPGRHLINVRKHGKHIDDSPYVIMVEEPRENVPTVGYPVDVNMNVPNLKLPDELDDLESTLKRPNGKEEPVSVKLGPDDTVAVSFTPREPGEHILSVKKKGKHIPDSPFSIMVAGKAPKGPIAGHPCDVNIDSPDIRMPRDLKDLEAFVRAPNGKKTPADCKEGPDGTLAVAFTPKEPGKHLIDVLKKGKPVEGSPFPVMVMAPEEAPVVPTVNEPVECSYDIPDVSMPKDLKDLEAFVTPPNGKKEPADVKEGPNGTVCVDFTPKEPGKHKIDVLKKGKPVKGSPFEVDVEPKEEPITSPTVGHPCDVNLDIPGVTLPEDLKHLKATVQRPNGQKEPLEVTEGPDNTLAISFTPKEPGKHLIDVQKNGRPVKGSPFEIMVEEAKPSGRGPTVGNPCDVNLDIDGVKIPEDLKDISAVLARPNGQETPVDVKEGPGQTLSVEFVPEEPGKHLLHVKKKRRPVNGSPFTVMVEEAQPEDGRRRRPRRKRKAVKAPDVKIPEDLKDLTAYAVTPSKNEKPVHVAEGPDKTLEFSFEPDEPGEYLIHVKKRGRPLRDSPFSIMVTADELDAEDGGFRRRPRKRKGVKAPDVDIPGDLKDMSAYAETPSGKEIPAELSEGLDKTLEFSFEPEEPGAYKVHVKKRRRPIKDSPFTVEVVDGDLSEPDSDEKGRRRPRRKRKGVKAPDVDIPGDLKDMSAYAETPTGKEIPAELSEGPDKTLEFSFEPEEPGAYKVHVKKRRRPIKDSPFTMEVVDGDLSEPDIDEKGRRRPRRKRKGVKAPDVDIPGDLKDMSAYAETPSGKEIPAELSEGPDKTLEFSFEPEEPGAYKVHVKKRRRPIKDSPFTVEVVEKDTMEPTDDDEKRRRRPHRKRKSVKAPDVDIPGDLKDMSAYAETPSGKEIPAELSEGPNKTLEFSFEPEEPGVYKVHVKKRRRPIKDSPFTVEVVPQDLSEPPTVTPLVGRSYTHYLRPKDATIPNDLPDLSAYVVSPSGRELPAHVTQGPNFTLSITFVPPEPGVYLIYIMKRSAPLHGCPFTITVVIQPAEKQPKKGKPNTQCLHPEGVVIPDDLPDLKAYVESPSGKEEPAEVAEGPDHSLAVTFVPKELGKHLIHVKKRRRPIKESPFEVMVVADEPEKGPTVGSPCETSVPASGITPDDLPDIKAHIERPSGKEEPVDVHLGPNDSLTVSFVPEEPGKHLLHIKKRRRPIDGSPFVIMVEEAGPAKGPSVGNPCDVNLEIQGLNLPDDLPVIKGVLSRPNGAKEDLPCSVGPNNSLSVNFTPKEPGVHLIEVTKRGKPLPESPFKVIVEESVPSEKEPTVGSECDINLDIPNLNLPDDLKNIKGTLKRPSSTTEEPLTVRANPDNTLGVAFTPTEPGPHEVGILKRGKHVNSSPFIIDVQPAKPEREAGPTVGSPCDVSIEIPGIRIPQDLKHLNGSLTRPNGKEEPLELKAGPDQTLLISFVPQEPGKHLINIKRGGQHVPSSPVVVMVDKAKPKKPGQQCDVGLEIPGIKLPDDLKLLTGTVETPSGNKEPVELQPGPNNKTILVSFLPKEVGKHKLHIKKNGTPVGGSPFEIVVKPEDVVSTEPDASKVRIYGKGLNGGPPNQRCEFVVDTRDAGYGGLGLSIEGPSKVEINCVDNEDGTCTVDFTPTEEGTYTINVTYADEHVPGSPVKIRISDKKRRPVEEGILATDIGGVESTPDVYSDILAFPRAKPQQDFVIKFAGSKDLKASVTRPSGVEDDAEVVETGKDTYTVRFVPKETGEHLVHVKHRSRDIPGSPFKVLVETPAGGASSCRAFGPGLERGVANHPCKFTVVTRDAGPGGLAVAVEGPAKAEIQCHDNGDGSCDITWYPIEAGEYTIHIRFADEPIPGSAFNVNVVPEDESSAMSMQQFKDQVLRMGQQASFAVQMKGKRGKISASVVAPTGAEIECTVVELDQGNYAVRFVPRELGDHRVNVFLDGQHIPGSPFVVRVGGIEGDPSKVRAYGPGLRGGVVNRPAQFVVNALEAGSGALALSIDGPAKVKMNCVEQEDGTYQVSYTPTVAGSYEISIRFAGQHIPGSPYRVLISTSADGVDGPGQSDASKCTSRGPGLRRATVGEAATFTVDAGDAGRGMIMVGVEGPVIPAKEILVRHTGNNVYSVNYILEEPGEYVLSVLWGGAHIPGSPFHVTV